MCAHLIFSHPNIVVYYISYENALWFYLWGWVVITTLDLPTWACCCCWDQSPIIMVHFCYCCASEAVYATDWIKLSLHSPIQTSPNCPAPSFFTILIESLEISQASLSHGFWALGFTQGRSSLRHSPSALSGGVSTQIVRSQAALLYVGPDEGHHLKLSTGVAWTQRLSHPPCSLEVGKVVQETPTLFLPWGRRAVAPWRTPKLTMTSMRE